MILLGLEQNSLLGRRELPIAFVEDVFVDGDDSSISAQD